MTSSEYQERELKIKRHASNQRTFLLGLALIAIVLGVVVPVWLDSHERAQRGETLDQIENIVQKLDAEDSPEAYEELVATVHQLTMVIKCNELANLDALLAELEARGDIPPGSLLACPDPPVFTFPPNTGENNGSGD